MALQSLMLRLGFRSGAAGHTTARGGAGRGWALVPWVVGWLLVCPTAAAADLVTGLFYYVVEDLDNGRVIQRGTAGSTGVAFDRLLLPSDRRIRVWLLQAETLRVAEVELTTRGPGATFQFPAFDLREANPFDTDRDELPDIGEHIMGTDPLKADTDGDGVTDGAEVRQGTDPLSGLAVRTGVIASADTPGEAKDVCVVSDMAIVADGTAGVSIFNVFNGMNPVLITQVDTPGDAMSVACGGGRLIALADRSGGLVVIDVTDPPASAIARQVRFGSDARCVAAADNFAFVGLANGQIAVVDMPSGTELSRFVCDTKPLQDLFLAGDELYAQVEGTLHVLSFVGGALERRGSVGVPGTANNGNGRMRLFVGGGVAYPVAFRGYRTVDVSIPTQPMVIQGADAPEFGWKQMVANGSGLGVAARSPNSTLDGPHNIALYDLSDPAVNTAFLVEYPTPGVARAVALYNGLAYVADHTAGLQVVNFLAYDNLGVPPVIGLTTSFGAGVAEEGQLMRVTATVSDDVQVRNVEFYVDGVKVVTDGSFPFEHRFTTPLLSPSRSSFAVRARASDTGGNASWSATLVLDLVPDATPPRVLRVNPEPGALLGRVEAVTAYLSEPIDQSSLNGTAFRVVSAGPDGVPNTGDDAVVADGEISYREQLRAAVVGFADPLPAGLYRVEVGAPLADLAGNVPIEAFSWAFRVFGREDRDGDGVPDELESALGLDPDNSDSDADGNPDGREDFDGDGLMNAGEVLAETDPTKPDTDGNGVPDGAEDPDRDALPNAAEIAAGTNPLVADSDGDGWNDETEVVTGSDPMDPASKPQLLVVSRPRLSVGLPAFGTDGGAAANLTVARPRVLVGLPSFSGLAGFGATTVASPPLSIGVPAFGNEGAFEPGVTVARPPLSLQVSAFESGGGAAAGTAIARPPVRIEYE